MKKFAIAAMVSAAFGQPSTEMSKILTEQVSVGYAHVRNVEESPNVIYINQEDIIKSGARNLSELLEIFVPGFEYQFNKWNGVVWGASGVMSDQNDKMAVFYNGIPVSQIGNLGYKAEATSRAFLDNVERVEIYLGQVGEMYGPGAISGAVNIVSTPYRPYHSYAESGVEVNTSGNLGFGASAGFSNRVDGVRTYTYASVSESPGIGYNKAVMYGSTELLPYNGNRGAIPQGGSITASSYGKTPGDAVIGMEASGNDWNFSGKLSETYENLAPFYFMDPWFGMDDSGSVSINEREFTRGGDELYMLWSNRNMLRVSSVLGSVQKNRSFGLPLSLGGSIFSSDIRVANNSDTLYNRGSGDLIKQYGETQYRGFVKTSGTILGNRVTAQMNGLFADIGNSPWGRNINSDGTTEWVPDNRLKAMYPAKVFEVGLLVGSEGYLGKSSEYSMYARTDYNSLINRVMPAFKAEVSTAPIKSATVSIGTSMATKNPSAESYGAINGIDGKDNRASAQYAYPQDTLSRIVYPITRSMRNNLLPEVSNSVYSNAQIFHGPVALKVGANFSWYRDMLAWEPVRTTVLNAYEYSAASFSGSFQYRLGGLSAGGSLVWQFPVSHNGDSISMTLNVYRPEKFSTDPRTGAILYKPVETGKDTVIKIANPAKWSVTYEGENFVNIHPVIGKVWVDWGYGGFNASSSIRVFSPMYGRAYGSDFNDGWAYYHPSVKMIVGLGYKVGKWSATIHAYNVLSFNTVNTLRYQQSVDPTQREAYSFDRPALALIVRRGL